MSFWMPSLILRLTHLPSIADAKHVHRPFLLFNSMPVCNAAAARILGMSIGTLRTLRTHAETSVNPPVDARTANKAPPDSEARHNAELLLSWIHQFLAEPLAESALPKDAAPSLQSLLDMNSLAHTSLCLEQRWLPSNTTLTELLHTAWSFATIDGPPPSYSTFLRVFHEQKWQKALKFRTESQHAKCTDCEKLKQFKRNAYSKADSERVAKAYHEHLSAMFRDRQLDARINARAMQYAKGLLSDKDDHGNSILSLCIDGMDTSKFKCPRNFSLTKDFEKMTRPEVKCTCILTEGMHETFFLLADHSRKDSNMSLTLLGHALAQAQDYMKENNLPRPSELRIHSDNAAAEAKNQVSMKWSSLLLHQEIVKKVTWTQFLVGHSHSKIDQRFSEVRGCLCAASTLQDARNMFWHCFFRGGSNYFHIHSSD